MYEYIYLWIKIQDHQLVEFYMCNFLILSDAFICIYACMYTYIFWRILLWYAVIYVRIHKTNVTVADRDNFHPSGKQRTKFCSPFFPVCPCFSECISSGVYKVSLKVIHPLLSPFPLFFGFICLLCGKFFFNFRLNSIWHIFMTEDLLWRTSSNHRT